MHSATGVAFASAFFSLLVLDCWKGRGRERERGGVLFRALVRKVTCVVSS